MTKEAIQLGQKIRHFRKRANISQLDLELAINAAHGSISRLETGRVNPTKETLLAIAQALRLNSQENAELLGLFTFNPTGYEIDEAKVEVADYLNRDDVIAYLLDDWAFVYAISKGLSKQLGFPEKQLEQLIGKNLHEILFDPQYGIRGILDPAHFMEIMTQELARSRAEANWEYSKLLESLMHFPDFKTAWERSEQILKQNLYSPTNKTVYLNIAGQNLQFDFSREKLKCNPRFELIEYYNPRPY